MEENVMALTCSCSLACSHSSGGLPRLPDLLCLVLSLVCCSEAVHLALSCLIDATTLYTPVYLSLLREEERSASSGAAAIVDRLSPTIAFIVIMFAAELEALEVPRFKSKLPFFPALKF